MTGNTTGAPASLEVFASLDVAPGNITFSPDGRVFLSLHQFHDPEICVCEFVDGELVPYPARPHAKSLELASVLGIQCDRNGWVWMLDNGDQSAKLPKLVAWDSRRDALARVFYLPPPLTHADSFVNDVAVDLTHNVVFISDPIQEGSAIIRVDIGTGLATRILEGHESVVPTDVDLVIDGTPVQLRDGDGELARPHLGVNGIVLDANDEWLYFCPMHARHMYRAKTVDLCDTALSAAQLAARVERYAERPICDGISIDGDNNIYLGDLAANGIGVIKADRSYELFVASDKLAWTDSLSFGPDGSLYCDSNQLHRSAVLNGGQEASRPPYYIMRVTPLAAGVVGR